jgi:hypothetical protein
MPALMQIDCVSKDDRLNPYERIRRVGGFNSPDVEAPDASRLITNLRKRGVPIKTRQRWSLPLDEAIRGVLDRKWDFYVQCGPHEMVAVEVARSPTGQLYLKTEVDADTPDQLLFLPECR